MHFVGVKTDLHTCTFMRESLLVYKTLNFIYQWSPMFRSHNPFFLIIDLYYGTQTVPCNRGLPDWTETPLSQHGSQQQEPEQKYPAPSS